LKRCPLANSRFTRSIAAIAFIALVVSVFIPFSTAALNPSSIQWTKSYNGLQVNSVIQTSDGGYAMVGTALSPGGATLIKTDSAGNLQWQKALGDAVSLAQTSDQGYVVFCINGEVIKTDADGNKNSSFYVKTNATGGLPTQINQSSCTDSNALFGASPQTGVRQGIIASDGNFIVIGNSFGQGNNTYAWLRKVDTQGKILWDINFTGGYTVSAVVNTFDRGCALAGNLKNNFWQARIDSNGNQQWSLNYVYGAPLDPHFIYSMAKTKDGGFILAGTGLWQTSSGMVPWLIKTNSLGYEQWDLLYGQYSNDSFSTIAQTPDEGYLIAQPKTASITRTTSNGTVLWQEQLDIPPIDTPSGYPSSCLIPTDDGGYLIAASTSGSAFLIKISPEATPPVPPTVTITSPQNTTYDTSQIPLTFTVNDQNSSLSYTLDGQRAIAINGNLTLTGLSAGSHNLTVYGQDPAGLLGTSQTITFTISAPFPTELAIAGITFAVAACACFQLYMKRQSLSNYRKKGLKSLINKQNLAAIPQNKLVWTLTIISLCFILGFIQVFLPYAYYSTTPTRSNKPFEVGISYVYEQDNIEQIYNEVSQIKQLGFTVIRINLVCDSNTPSSYLNTLTDVFFNAAEQLDMKVALIVNNHNNTNDINYYLDRWGKDITYVQIFNEPDVATSWNVGALFTDDEAGSKFNEIYAIVEQHNLSALRYTNFSPAFVARTNLPIQFSQKLDFVGLDVFMDSILTVSPTMIHLLQKITNKDVVITEFGMSTSNDATQADYLIRGLNLFKNMGLKGCWIVYWNSVENDYGIRGRLAEQKIGEWIAKNAQAT